MSIISAVDIRNRKDGGMGMNRQVLKWGLDLLMGIAFLTSFITGLLKFTLLVRVLGLTFVVLPLGIITDIHEWSGVVLGFCVAVHLFLNRSWIIAMTKKVLAGASVFREFLGVQSAKKFFVRSAVFEYPRCSQYPR